jgi:hypothetical protein
MGACSMALSKSFAKSLVHKSLARMHCMHAKHRIIRDWLKLGVGVPHWCHQMVIGLRHNAHHADVPTD